MSHSTFEKNDAMGKRVVDYDTQFGANAGAWTTDMFIEAVYSSLEAGPAKR